MFDDTWTLDAKTERMWGVRNDAPGEHMGERLRFLHPDDRIRVLSELRSLQVGAITELETQYRVNVPGTQTTWIRTSARAEQESGATLAVVGINKDITDVRVEELEREELVKRIFPDLTRDVWAYMYRSVVEGDTKLLQTVSFDTHEVVMTLSGHEKGKTLEAAGGFVLTSDMWLGPKIAALDELSQFELKYMRAVYGDAFMGDAQQMASMVAMYPAFQGMSARMQTEGKKMQGTPVSTIVTFESVKSAEQMKATEDQQPASNSGGGIGGMLGRRLAGNRGGAPQARTKIMTTKGTTSTRVEKAIGPCTPWIT